MNITDFNIQLEFSLDKYAFQKYQDKWLEIKRNVEFGENNMFNITDLLLDVKNNCTIISNRKLPLLKRTEYGLGGDSNLNDKQLRFFNDFNNEGLYVTRPIKIDMFNSNNNNDTWNLEELNDLVNAFVKAFNNIMKEECCYGKITLYKYK